MSKLTSYRDLDLHCLEECDECTLRSKSRDKHMKVLEKHGKKFGEINPRDALSLKDLYDCYLSPNNSQPPHFVFLMQNPGTGYHSKKGVTDNYCQELADRTQVGDAWKERSRIHRERLLKWLGEKYGRATKSELEEKSFCEEFFNLLRNNQLPLSPANDYRDYFGFDSDPDTSKFLLDFHVTDLVKCKATTGEIDDLNLSRKKGRKESVESTCYAQFLRKELERLPNDTLIFLFSRRVWEFFKDEVIDCENEGDRPVKPIKWDWIHPARKSDSLTAMHGKLFKLSLSGKNYYVIPLIHFCGQGISNCPGRSYWEHLEEGVKAYMGRR